MHLYVVQVTSTRSHHQGCLIMWDTLSSLLVAELSVLPTVAALLVLAVAAWLWHVRAVPLSEKSGVGIGKFTPWFGHVR